ncbi:hypothetical protein Dsin_013525 [Dipteronia sinensis]|uniref:HD-Zip IV C-terminal domain-containing protein n=1 Tax=Dipteronia sinensis TaxID=43782 RepID=A0AAE0AKZ7_9ROSI|nr:hypothetical protein Dsin_013525 [Dipteronia sinensis]
MKVPSTIYVTLQSVLAGVLVHRGGLPTYKGKSECLAILMSIAAIAKHPLDTNVAACRDRSGWRKSFLTLAQCMMYNFCSGACASSLCNWDRLCVESVYEDVRVLTRRSRIDPGEPHGVVLSAATYVCKRHEKEAF